MKTQTAEIAELMLKSSDHNPYKGKLSKDDNIIAAIELALLCKDFADKGQVDEAMGISSEQWVEVIHDLQSLKHSEATMMIKKEYFKRNNYTNLIVLFTIFTLFSVITITKNHDYLVNWGVWSVPLIFVLAIVVIYFQGGAAYRNYKRNFAK